MESIQKRPEALELAQRCKMGDTAAMEAMALHYRTLCGPVLQALLDAYEIRPGEENRRALHLCLEENREARLPAEAYMMWLLRAARFGSRAAAERVRQLPYFMDYGARDHLEVYQAFPWELPIRSLLGRWGRRPERMAWGEELRNAGFPDLPAAKPGEQFSIVFWPSPGVYRVSWLRDGIPRDESGFGEESNYASLWLDEFFCPLETDRIEEMPDKLKRLDRLREEYWQVPAHGAPQCRYRERLRISTRLPWGKPWKEIAPLLGAEDVT